MRFILMISIIFLCSSCAVWDNTQEVGKTLWGSSTRALENARDNAMTKTYEKSYWDCVRSAIDIVKRKKLVLFKKDEIKGYLVVMGIPGSVSTTEVGIFFDELTDTQTRVEISSLSTNAKRKVSKILFHGLDIAFGYLPPDPPELKVVPVSDQDADQNTTASKP